MSDSSGMEALDYAHTAFNLARAGDTVGLKRLLDLGLPANVHNERGDSLVMLASYHGHLEATRLLLERGADKDWRSASGETAASLAAAMGAWRALSALGVSG